MSTDPTPNSKLETSINLALTRLDGFRPETSEYAASVDQIAKLHKMKEAEMPSRLSRDTLLLCVTNIAGILLIIKYEHFNVITSKALGFVQRPR